MIRLCAVGMACLIWSVPAPAAPSMAAMITPSPLGVVLTVGHWILNQERPVYYVEVEGRGISPEEARSNGYRLAVEQAVGSLISSETEVENSRIRRDEIIAYASGYVTRFEVTSTTQWSDGYRVKMKVWVGRSALADRLLNRSVQSTTIDGHGASVQLQTLNQERITGDRLLQTVLADFPRRSFDIEISATDIVRQNRAGAMEINFRIRWNQDYLRSLWTALDATAHPGAATASSVAVNSGSLFGFGGTARFDDQQKYRLVVSAMILSQPAVLVQIHSTHNEILYASCFYYQEMDHQPRYGVTTERFVRVSNYESRAYVDGAYRLRSRVQIPMNSAVLDRVNRVTLDVITQRECPR